MEHPNAVRPHDKNDSAVKTGCSPAQAATWGGSERTQQVARYTNPTEGHDCGCRTNLGISHIRRVTCVGSEFHLDKAVIIVVLMLNQKQPNICRPVSQGADKGTAGESPVTPKPPRVLPQLTALPVETRLRAQHREG